MTLNVLMLSPGYPAEMPTSRAAWRASARGSSGSATSPRRRCPKVARAHLAHHPQVRSLWDEPAVVREVQRWRDRCDRPRRVSLGAGMLLAAQLREALGLPGMTVEETCRSATRR
jgi:hypothetical protein